jgi:hypothetical protein
MRKIEIRHPDRGTSVIRVDSISATTIWVFTTEQPNHPGGHLSYIMGRIVKRKMHRL